MMFIFCPADWVTLAGVEACINVAGAILGENVKSII